MARPDHNLTRVLTGAHLGKTTARQLLALGLLAPFGLGWLWLVCEQRGFLNRELRLSLFVLGNMFIASISVIRATRALNRSDSRRTNAEADLRRNEHRFKVLTENSYEAVILRDNDGRITYASPPAYRVLGHAPEDLVGDDGFSLLHPDDEGGVRQRIDAILSFSGATIAHEFRIRQGDGSWRWVQATETNLLADPAVGAVVGHIQNITDRRQAEAEVRESEELFRGAFENTNIATVLTDIDNRFLKVNDAFGRLFGTPADMMAGVTMAEVTYPDDLAESYARRDDLLAGRATHFQLEKRYHRLDGSVFWGLTNVALARDSQGRPLRYVAQVQDITERKHAEENLRKSEGRYRELFESNPHPMWVVDGQTSAFLAVNDAAVRSYGFSRDEFLKMTTAQLSVPQQTPGPVSLEPTDEQSPGILRHRWKNGSVRIVATHSHELVFAGRPALLVLADDITERVHAEDQLRESEQRFRLMVDSVKDYAIIVLDAEGRVASWNAAGSKISGYREDEVRGQSFARFYPEEAIRQGHPQRVLKQAAERGRFDDEGWRVRKDGSRYWADVVISAARDRSGQLLGFVKVSRDATDRKRAEDALRYAESRFRALVEQSIAGFYVIEEDRLTYANPKMTEILGLPFEELVSRPVLDFVADEDRAMVENNLREQFAGGMPSLRYQFRMRHREGRLVYVEFHGIRTEHDGQAVILGVLLDVTERHNTEAALRESKARFGFLADATPQIVWTARPDGELDYYNRRWYEYTGRTSDNTSEGIGEPVVHPDDFAQSLRLWTDACQTGHPYEIEYRLRRASDGAYRWHLGKAVPRRNGFGEIIQWVGTCTDIDDLKRAQDDLRQFNAELEQRVRDRTAALEAANKELESFSYSVSHDLRAPLRAVDGFARILLEDFGPQLPEEAGEHLREIRDSARQMGQLVDDLLAFSRLGRQSIKLQTVQPKDLVRQCVTELRSENTGRHVEVEVADLMPCRGDPALLKQVWANLLENAFKYTRKRDPARVEVGCRLDEERAGSVVYYVADNGVGFDMRYVKKLFGVFQRLHRAEEYEGNGVGLATVHRIIHRHGGRVWAVAKPGEGTTLFFSLPGAGDES